MNKLLFGLLLAAAGTGIFLLTRKKKNISTNNEIHREWIIGKWKAESGKDSAFSRHRYDFLKDGSIVRSPDDSAKADTSYYTWKKDNALIWKEHIDDSTGEMLTVMKWSMDSLQFRAVDSSTILFTRMK